tara:strand:+ start:26 stop:508 length:483 start_codon:yes stop_codon:yes gene_type:complete
MNIFFLHKDPQWAANALCDKHVPKMLLESAQMLSTAVQENAGERLEDLYKPAYPKHPMTKWVGSTFSNFQWTLENAVFISQEYCKRFNKLHKSSRILNVIYDNQYYKEIPDERFTTPPQCMPDEYKDNDYVTAYRKYYQGAKAYFAKWQRGVPAPDWWAV